jgi:hypothetical protein
VGEKTNIAWANAVMPNPIRSPVKIKVFFSIKKTDSFGQGARCGVLD